MSQDYIAAHAQSIRHREQILKSDLCGCFYCMSTFKVTDILDWCDTSAPEIGAEPVGQTALCPRCSIDSVIGTESGYPITKEFLKQMNKHWF